MRSQSLARATARLAVGLRKRSANARREAISKDVGRQWMELLEGRVLLSTVPLPSPAPVRANVSPAAAAAGAIGPTTAEISGFVFYDSNGDGSFNNFESTSPYWLVYLDTNNNGIHDAGEMEVRGD